jgi:DNA (cytosine-5)-methyltransferase 1
VGKQLTVLELCAGAGGQALGFERAGFEHVGLVEIDRHACSTLRHNRPEWSVVQGDLRSITPGADMACDVIAAGIPCPPFSRAGKQLGEKDERDLFPALLNFVRVLKPRGVLIENVRGLLDPAFAEYREALAREFREMGLILGWKLLDACHFGIPQHRGIQTLGNPRA